jgi:PAS domain S-box-containing protein
MFGLKWRLHQKILDHMMNGVYVVDPDKKVRFWNSAAEAITGKDAAQAIGSVFDERTIRYADDRGNTLRLFEYPVTVSFQEKRPVSRTLVMKTEDGLDVPVEETASPLYENGRLLGVVSTFRDISTCIRSVDARLKTERKERLIPICGWCKKIRSDEDYWEQLETYLTNEGFGIFTHGMCPSCADKIFEKKIYLESYQDICRSISASISLDEVLQLIVTNVVKVMNVKASLLRLLNKQTKQLEIAAYYGLSERYANKGPVGYDASIDDALAGKSVSVYDIAEAKDSRYYKEAAEEGIRSILSIPLRFEKEVIGVLRMYTTEPVKYTDEDLQFISAIAEQGAIAIINARRFETAVSNEKEYLRVFEEITKAVSSSLNVHEVLNMIVKKIPEVMGLKGSTLRLLNKENNQLELAAYYGLSEKYANKGPVTYDASIDDALAGKPVSRYDITEHKDSRYYKEAVEEGIRTILSIPMIFQKEVIGVLRLYTSRPMKYKYEDLRFMSGIAEQTAIAIVNAKQFEKELSKEKEYLEVFQEVTKALSVSLRPREVLDMIVRKIPEVMDLKAATVRLLDPEGKKLELVAAYGLSEEYLNKGPVDAEKNVIEAMKEKAVAIYDVTTDHRVQYREEAAREGIKSMLTLPIIARGKLLGILRLLTSEHREFSAQEIDFVELLAEQSGIAIINAQYFEQEISKEKQYLEVFQRVTKAVNVSLRPKEVLTMIVKKIPEVMNLKAATIRLLDPSGGKLRLVAAHGLSETYLSRGPVDDEVNVIAALNEKPVAIHDVTTDDRITYKEAAKEEGIKSMLTLPVMARGKVLGILRLLTGEPREFSRQEIDFAASLADQCGVAIENAIMYEKAKKDYDDIMKDLDNAVMDKE